MKYALVLLALAMRVQLALGTHTINQDGPYYLDEAHTVHEFGPIEGWRRIGPRKLVATVLAPFTGDVRAGEPWAVGICALFGALGVLPMMALARRMTSPELAGLLYALHPIFVYVQSEVLSEGIAHLFVLSAAAGLAAWLETASWSRLIGGTLACAAAALCRPDGLALCLLMAPLLAAWAIVDRRRWAARLAGAALFVAIFAGPALGGIAFSRKPDESVWNAVARTVHRYAAAQGSRDRPEGWQHVEDVERFGNVTGSAYYLAKQLLPLPTLVLVPFVLVGIARRHPPLNLTALLALFALAMVLWTSTSHMHRVNSRYFSLPWLLMIPAAAEGLARTRRPFALLVVAAALAVPSLGERRFEHVSERHAWESMADRAGETLFVVGGTRARAEFYAGIRSRLAEGDLDDPARREIGNFADRGEIDAILLFDCRRDDPWLQDLVARAVAAWGPHEQRRFPQGEHGATLYLRPPLDPPVDDR